MRLRGLSFRHSLRLLVLLAAIGPVLLATGVLLFHDRVLAGAEARHIAASVRGHAVAIAFVLAASTLAVYLLAARVQRALARPGRETVLVVEDELSLRQLTRELLEAQGYAVIDAASGPEALRLLREHGRPVDLLLTDVIMPVMSGRQLAQRVQETLRQVRGRPSRA